MDVSNEKYLAGYLNHFRKLGDKNFSYNTFNYIERHGNDIFKDIIDGLMNGSLLKIFRENERYVDIVINYCASFMGKDKFLKENFKDIGNSILDLSLTVKEDIEEFTDIQNIDKDNSDY